MPELTPEQRLFIVRRLACFASPTQVAEAVKEEFGIEVDRRHVGNYSLRNPKLSKAYREEGEATRKEYIESAREIGISHQTYRLEQLGELYLEARKTRNRPLAVQIIETAAKETGGAYTSRRDVTLTDPDEVLARILGVSKDKLPT